MEQWWAAIAREYPPWMVVVGGTFIVHQVAWLVFNLPYLLLDRFKLLQSYRIAADKYPSQELVWGSFWMLLRGHVLQLLPLTLLSYPLLAYVGFHTSPVLPSWQEILVQLVVFNIVEDAGFYWVHKWMHTPWAYNKYHKRHHEFVNVFSLTGEIAHPVEFFCNFLVPLMAGPFITAWFFGTHIVTHWLWLVFRELRSTDAHSGYALPFHPLRLLSPIYGGAEAHFYHHSVQGRKYNLGGYKFWDWLMGTDKGYAQWRSSYRLANQQAAAATTASKSS